MPAKPTPRLRGMVKDRIVIAVRHARKTLVQHRRLNDRRTADRIAPRTQVDRLKDIADLVADLRHYAGRYDIAWEDVDHLSLQLMDRDKED